MHKSLKTIGAATLVGVLSIATVAGCESVERETGVSKRTQMGAGAGAAVGGVIAAIAGANPAWIAASTILGGVAGGVLTDQLDRRDAEKHASNQYSALNTLQQGETSRWNNADTGRSGSTTVTNVFKMADGTTCKNFTEVIDTGERTFRENATACKAPGGDWTVRKSS